ncbi:FK506-binding protein 5 [Patella vulgata]|uniref:FK506-binding protein 5 n=1 Tax=Patella vulgata TaxID=6465 RepID=UPI0024A9D589|nr:FK506-binding protein 5 [Patella vulgata]
MEDCKLYQAIKDNNVVDVNKLLADGEDTKLRNENGDTLLHVVVKQNGSLEIFKALVSKISDTSLLVRNEAGQTVYDLVVSSDYANEAGDVLKEAVWSWGVQGGWERLQAIAAQGWDAWPYSTQQATEKSKEDGEYMDKIEKFQEEVNKLHSAVMEGNEEVVRKFLEEGNVTLLTSADRTGTLPLQKAIIFQQIHIINLFLDSKHKKEILDTLDNMKRTACHYAGGCHDAGQIYSMLQEAGADESIKDLVGKLPSDYNNNPLELSVMEVKKRISAILTPEDKTDTTESSPLQEVENKPVTDTTQSTETSEKVSDSQSDSAYKPLTPSTSSTRKPIQMYISTDIYEKKDVPPPATVDGRYIARHLGTALTSALAEIAECRPWDPIEYLGHWLIKYRKNLDYNKSQEDIMKDVRSEEAAMDEEEELRAKRLEEERQIQEAEEKQRREKEEEERKKREEEEELQKKAKEAALLQKPLLPTVTEELEEDTMYKERDERGQTELHKLAAQEGADLVALFNLGYSLADRDGNNQTPRDIAEDHDIQENIDAMDSYISNMIEQEKLEALQQLLLDGYDKLGVVLSQVSTDGLPDEVTDFLKAVPDFQAKISQALKAVESGVLRDVAQYLDRKKIALAKDIYGRSPLHIAVLIENKEIVQYIIKHYPTAVKCRDNLNRTPLHYASALSEEITNILTSSSADQQAKDVRDRIPAYYSTEKSEIQQIQIAFRTGKVDNSDTTQTETESEQVAEQSKTETEQVTSATD